METNWASVSSSSTVTIGRRPTNSGMKPKPSKSSGSTYCRTLSRSIDGDFVPLLHGAKAHDVLAQAALDDVFQPDEGAAADEQDAAGVHADVFLLGMLAAALRRDVANGAFEDFQQGLLDAFAGNVARDGDVLGLARDLVDFVNIDDAPAGRA